jgi:hypothetical protein
LVTGHAAVASFGAENSLPAHIGMVSNMAKIAAAKDAIPHCSFPFPHN